MSMHAKPGTACHNKGKTRFREWGSKEEVVRSQENSVKPSLEEICGLQFQEILIALVWGLGTEKFFKFSRWFLYANKIENHGISEKWDQLSKVQSA